MSTKQPFKNYVRGQRIQDTNIIFSNGMSFTNAPLEEGFSRLLVNYDFDTNSRTLKPRKGLQTTAEGLYQPLDNNNALGYATDGFEHMSIVAGDRCFKNGKIYYQIIVGQIVEKEIARTDEIYRGNAWVLTCRSAIVQGVQKQLVYYTPLNNELTGYCIFSKPTSGVSEIHGVPLKESGYIKNHVGTFAFNGQYYYFCADGKLHYTYFDSETEIFKAATETAYRPYHSETKNNLYNMLLEDPYDFAPEAAGTVFRVTGFMACERTSEGNLKPKVNPKVGASYPYKMLYSYPEGTAEEYCFHIVYNSGVNDIFYPIERDETTPYTVGIKQGESEAKALIFEDIRVDSPTATFIFYAVKKSEATFNSNNQIDEESLKKAIIGHASFSYVGSSELDTTVNQKSSEDLINYDLSYATEITYWKNRLWLFGAKASDTALRDNTVLFTSDVNRPDWFPYSANVDIFDEDIIHLQPMLDDLLVFTAHNLYSLTLSEDGLSWNKRHLQSNLSLSPWDLNLIQIVKNMVFFKSGNYYYMVVPKLTATSGTGLAIAPISKNITHFLDNFKVNVEQIVDDLYNFSNYTIFNYRARNNFELNLVHYYNFLDFEDVHNCYIFECTKKEKIAYDSEKAEYITNDTTVYLNLELLYNTVSRTWRIYTSESQTVRQPLFKNATGGVRHAELVVHDNKANIQFIQKSETSLEDLYIKQNSTEATPPILLANWQYLDTGNLNQNSEIKKRFREYQFKINNESSDILEFYSGFIVDKAIRTYEMLYTTSEIPDNDSDNDGTNVIVIDAQPKAGMQGAPVSHSTLDTELSSTDYTYTKLGSWKLNTSKFPESTIWKIRIPTSGKGYLPRIILISYNTTDYELLSCATVYRQLYSR